VRYQGSAVDEAVVSNVRNFFFVYIVTLFVLSMLVMATGVDFLSATSAVAQGMANAGPGLGPLVGPSTNFSAIPELAKWWIMAAMILGRLELMTFYVMLIPAFWRR
jgi:trk system potassium uptake protein